MSKFVSLLLAGAIATGAVSATTMMAGPAMACSAPKHSPALTRFVNSLPTLRPGSSGAAVLGLQMYLRQNGLTYLQGTGYYGPLTTQAVKHFQAKHNLPVTGEVTHSVWRKINNNDFHLPIPNYPNPQLSPGEMVYGPDREFAVGNMATRLSGLDWFDQGSDSFVYGGKLLSSVQLFQQRVGLQGTGIWGVRTTNAMNTVIAIAGDWSC
jgi:peptidoglycan hydrolase-like protein with peptidoglycan-binding domain